KKRTSISIPTISKQTNTMMITCSKCFRLNNLNARFCDVDVGINTFSQI
ncbi:unnamed protein product, partial [Rotaria sp. Silwood1]